MFGAWNAYTGELENFQENLDRLQNRLASDPNVGTTDVQVLEHELALAKVRNFLLLSCILTATTQSIKGSFLVFIYTLQGRRIHCFCFCVRWDDPQ